MNRLWTFGCSFTAEYNPIEGVYHPFENQYDRYKKFKGGKLPLVWSELLGKKIEYQTMNCGVGGSSNYSIFRQYINVCDIIKKGDILIFGWTSMLRFPVINLNGYKEAVSAVLDNLSIEPDGDWMRSSTEWPKWQAYFPDVSDDFELVHKCIWQKPMI